MEKVGYVLGEANTREFIFVTDEEKSPSRLEYIELKDVKENHGDGKKEVNVLARVSELSSLSDVLKDDLSLDGLESIKERYNPSPKIYGKAEVIGYLDKDAEKETVVKPRSAPLPGHEVYIASDELLKEFFTKNIEHGLDIGSLISRQSVNVKLDPNGLRRHLAIIAQTGAGKSYLSGLVIEQLIQLGGTVLIFDPNSDYVKMRYKGGGDTRTQEKTEFADRIEIYRPPGVAGRRFDDEEIGNSKDFTVRFSQLRDEDIFNFAGVPQNANRIRQAIRQARETLSGNGEPEENEGFENEYKPEELLDTLEDIEENGDGEEIRGGARKAKNYIQSLTGLDIWGYKDLPIDEIKNRMQASVVDLAGMPSYISEFVVDKTLNELWNLASTGKLDRPIFVVLEEAHNFVPAQGSTYSSSTINKLASEGRKFGIFLTVLTQRPYKIDQETLSQCNSQIIMKLTNPIDQQAVQKASESMTEELLEDLPGLNVGEAIVTGELTRSSVMVNIGGRESAEGGSDIDVVAKLNEARQQESDSEGSFNLPEDSSTEGDY